jgi:hypothetical protein
MISLEKTGGQEQDQAIMCVWSMDFNILCTCPISSSTLKVRLIVGYICLMYFVVEWRVGSS